MINVERVKNILLSPATEWQQIAAEPDSIGGIISKYLIWLVGLGALITFLSLAVFGQGFLWANYKVGFGTALAHALAGALLSLAMIYLLSLAVNTLAPKFGGTSDGLNAFKLVAYSSTAGLVGAVFSLIPFLGVLAFVAAIYSIVLFYQGLPVLMKNPDKTGLFTLVSMLCALGIGIVVGTLSGLLLPDISKDSTLTIQHGGKDIKLDGGSIDKFTKRVEQAGEQMEQAAQSGNAGDMAKAAAGALGSLFGDKDGKTRKPISTETLKALVPETMGKFTRTSFEVEAQKMLGFEVSSVKSRYKLDAQTMTLNVTDLGTASGLMALADWAMTESEKENDRLHERTFRDGKRIVSETSHKDGSRAVYKLMLANGIAIEANGTAMQLDQLKAAINSLDLDALESAR